MKFDDMISEQRMKKNSYERSDSERLSSAMHELYMLSDYHKKRLSKYLNENSSLNSVDDLINLLEGFTKKAFPSYMGYW